MTKRRRHTPDQIIRKLAEGNKLLAGGTELGEVCGGVVPIGQLGSGRVGPS